MKKKSVLNRQSISKKEKKTRSGFSIFSFFKRVIPAVFKMFFLFVFVMSVSLSLLYGYHYLHTSSAVRIEQVEVVGVEKDIRNELIEMCDLAPDANLLFIDLKALKKELETHPCVKTVKLKRLFPHTLYVEAEEYRPYALVVMDRVYFMDKNCHLFKEVEMEDTDYPVITGVTGHPEDAFEQLSRAVEVISFLSTQKEPWSAKNLSEVHMNNHNIALYFAHLPIKIITMGENLKSKMSGLTKVTKHLVSEGKIHQVTSIDLNSIEGAVVTFKRG